MTARRTPHLTTLPWLLLAGLGTWPATAGAQQLAALRLDRDRAGLMETVRISIDLGAASGENIWCGLRISYGNGDFQDVRAEQSPMVVFKQYPVAGRYTVRVSGEAMTRGLKSASACQGGPYTAQLEVVDAAAERRRQDAQRAADAQAAQTQGQAQAVAERERMLAQREQQLQQRGRTLDEREQKLATREREQDERERRLRSREAQVAVQQAMPAPAPAPAPVAPPPPAPAPKPKSDKSLTIF